MKIYLNTLTLSNFRGEKSRVVDFGKNTCISGENGTGKTTIADSFFFLLFGKDSRGNADFSAKPQDENGKDIHHLDTEVVGAIEIHRDGIVQDVELKRTMSEKWTKPRGKATKELTGHTTDFYINGVKKKQKEYQAFVKELCDEKLFRMITDPTAFPSLHWSEQRQILFDMVTVDESILEDEFPQVKVILGGKTLDDRRSMLKASLTDLNKQLKEAPIRIKEQERNLVDVEMPKTDELEAAGKIKELKDKLVCGSTELLEKKSELFKKQIAMEDSEREAHTAKFRSYREKKDDLEATLDQAKCFITRNNITIDKLELEIGSLDVDMKKLRDSWHFIKDSKFSEEETTCPTCGQCLPSEKIEDSKKSFAESVALNLKKLSDEGKAKKVQQEEKQEKLQELTLEVSKASVKKQELENKIAELVSPGPLALSDELQAVIKQIADIEEQIKSDENNAESLNLAINEAIKHQETILSEWAEYRAGVKAIKSIKFRIDELKEEQKTASAEYENIQEKLFILDQYLQRKVDLVEGQINKLFTILSFKLFKEQVNGGIDPYCEITVNGIGYNRDLNTGSRFQAGLEMCRVLQNHHSVEAPVFMDNAERITTPIEEPFQLIELRAVKGMDKLTFETC